MANELSNSSFTGLTLYAQVRNAAGQVWNGSAFEAYNAAHWATYALALTETTGTGLYYANFPAGIVTAGRYGATVFWQAGASPAVGDLPDPPATVDWDGAAAVGLGAVSVSPADVAAIAAAVAGSGDYPIDHNGGSGAAGADISIYAPWSAGSSVGSSADVMQFTVGVFGAAAGTITAYVASDFDANARNIIAQQTLGAHGRWNGSIYLDSGTYYLEVRDPNVAATYRVKVVVP